MRLDRDASILEHYVIDELASQAGGYFSMPVWRQL